VTEAMVNGPDDVYVERERRIDSAAQRLLEGEESALHLMDWVGQCAPWALRRSSMEPLRPR